MILLTYDPIDYSALTESVRSPAAGAAVLFLGTVREFTDGRQTLRLHYEAYPRMAEAKLQELLEQAAARWPIVKGVIAHRLGQLELGEVSVAVAVSTPHRRQAFEAGQWLIDTLKEVVPIWKQENWADGSQEWVHPGLSNPSLSDPSQSDPSQSNSGQSNSGQSNPVQSDGCTPGP